MIKRLIFILSSFFLTLHAGRCQQFLYRAPLDTVPLADGFYKIAITPQIAGLVKKDLADIRLYDRASQEVPYIVQQEEPIHHKQLFKEYEIISRVSKPKSGTSLVLRNANRGKINNISLLIQNTNVTKKAQLSGSNDAKEWYSIDDRFVIQPVKSESATSEVRVLDFPLSDYEYYKLDINDSLSAPIHIIKAGYYDTYTENGKYTSIEGLRFVQKDSAALKQSFVYVQLKQPVSIHKVTIEVAAPLYYVRQVEVKVARTTTDRRRRSKTYDETVAYATLHASTDHTLFTDQLYTKEFYLLIHNGDNLPLQIKDIKAYQLNTYLVASLRQGEAYELKFGQATLQAPGYDLAYFTDKLPATIPVLQAPTIVSMQPPAVALSESPLFANKMLIWVAICLVIALLAYMSFRMVKDMKGH